MSLLEPGGLSLSMNKYVLDASALLALINKEAGHEIVADVVAHSVISTVNVTETVTILQKHGIKNEAARIFIADIVGEIVAFEEEHAFAAAALNTYTSKLGLSLGDRACLSVAKHLKLPVLSADKVWSKLKIGVLIKIIR